MKVKHVVSLIFAFAVPSFIILYACSAGSQTRTVAPSSLPENKCDCSTCVEEQDDASTGALRNASTNFGKCQNKAGKVARLIVAGMHHSGTSMLTGLLQMAGVTVMTEDSVADALSGSATGGDSAARHGVILNRRGYFEFSPALTLNDFILALQNQSWFYLCNWNLSEAFSDDRFIRARAIAASVLTRSHNRARSPFATVPAFALKDPRFSLTLPLWLHAVPSADVCKTPTACLITVSDPSEVGYSFMRYHRWEPEQAYALWELYMIAAMKSCSSVPTFYIYHAVLRLSPMRSLRKLFAELSAAGVADISLPSPLLVRAFIDPVMHHTAVPVVDDLKIAMWPELESLYQYLLHNASWSQRGERSFSLSARASELLCTVDRNWRHIIVVGKDGA